MYLVTLFYYHYPTFWQYMSFKSEHHHQVSSRSEPSSIKPGSFRRFSEFSESVKDKTFLSGASLLKVLFERAFSPIESLHVLWVYVGKCFRSRLGIHMVSILGHVVYVENCQVQVCWAEFKRSIDFIKLQDLWWTLDSS